MEFEPVIGLEVHAELATQSKMFCACPVVDVLEAEPNTAVCPVCAGMPGVLPVVNKQAVEMAIRVALALECKVARTSIFARKNYFYPDLPKGYQISQYDQPLAENGRLPIVTSAGEQFIRVRRVHLEEDTGKLTHVDENGETFSLVDLNRAGISLLEMVSEPDMHSVEEARAYASALRSVLRYLGVNSGDMQKGVIRFEANISVRPKGSTELGTRTEIKNLNSFRALERSVAYEIVRQSQVLRDGGVVRQETLGWDEKRGVTLSQRSKEEAHDYRYFPEPDLPPLVVEPEWVERVRTELPELPYARYQRFQRDFGLSAYDADVLVAEQAVADYFEAVLSTAPDVPAKMVVNWVMGDLFSLINRPGASLETLTITPVQFAELIRFVHTGKINQLTAKEVLAEMFASGQSAAEIVSACGLEQISDTDFLAEVVETVLAAHPDEVQKYVAGKESVQHWLFGQVMGRVKGRANPQVVRAELARQLQAKNPNTKT